MDYQVKDFSGLIGLPGFSEQLLKNHFTLYQGYVTNTNKLAGVLSTLVKEGKAGTPEYAEQKRRFGWEFNGMRLHEYYFGNLVKTGAKPDSAGKLARKITEDFGSLETWEKDFKSAGAMRGIGWVILCYDPAGNRLFNIWVNEHDVGHLSGSVPLLVLDVFEHAFMLDYGLKRADYLEAFFKAIHWQTVEERYLKATAG